MTEESTGTVFGIVFKPLIEPDKGKILGFFVLPMPGVVSVKIAYVSSMDIVHFGTRIHIKDENAICDPYDIIRLQPVLEEGRPVLGQRIQTEAGEYLGKCADIQFDTESMRLTWLFPRKWFLWKTAVAVQNILEVRKQAIILQDQLATVPNKSTSVLAPTVLSKPSV